MKHILPLVALTITLAACTPGATTPDTNQDTSSSTSSILMKSSSSSSVEVSNSSASSAPSATSASSTTQRPKAKLGEFCGGIAGFQCEDGLSCRYEGNYPDAGGTCVK